LTPRTPQTPQGRKKFSLAFSFSLPTTQKKPGQYLLTRLKGAISQKETTSASFLPSEDGQKEAKNPLVTGEKSQKET